jgi:hypothetical protein
MEVSHPFGFASLCSATSGTEGIRPTRNLSSRARLFRGPEILQAQTALCDPFGVFYPHVAVVPRLPLVASIGLLTARVGEEKTVLVSTASQPLSSGCVTERHLHLVVCLRVREVNGGAELVLAVPGTCAHQVRIRAICALQPTVNCLLVLLGLVCRGHDQFLAIGGRC